MFHLKFKVIQTIFYNSKFSIQIFKQNIKYKVDLPQTTVHRQDANKD